MRYVLADEDKVKFIHFDGQVYIYRIRGGTATNLYSIKYYASSWPNWASASVDLSGWLVGDYLGLYCRAPDKDYYYPTVKDLYIKASPIVRTV